jgi:hypothetical protein
MKATEEKELDRMFQIKILEDCVDLQFNIC